MKSKQILDAFSETLMSDERILSAREHELLTNLLQNAKSASSGNEQIQAAVMAAIGRSIGETVAQRAFALLGGSIVEQIISRGMGASETAPESRGVDARTSVFAGPQPPMPKPEPEPEPEPDEEPIPEGPQPPMIRARRTAAGENVTESAAATHGVGVLERPSQAHCVVLDEFLAPQELDELIRYTLGHEKEFKSSEVVSPSEKGVTDYSHRRSRVLMDAGPHEEVILQRIRQVLPRVLDRLGMREFPVTRTELQITASNDGDFFRAHCDDAQQLIASRRLTFVYFFHREPKKFAGGELRLHDSTIEDQNSATGAYESIIPQQNQIVFFPCSTLHEITPVHCSSQVFADSRFTVNGWLHR